MRALFWPAVHSMRRCAFGRCLGGKRVTGTQFGGLSGLPAFSGLSVPSSSASQEKPCSRQARSSIRAWRRRRRSDRILAGQSHRRRDALPAPASSIARIPVIRRRSVGPDRCAAQVVGTASSCCAAADAGIASPSCKAGSRASEVDVPSDRDRGSAIPHPRCIVPMRALQAIPAHQSAQARAELVSCSAFLAPPRCEGIAEHWLKADAGPALDMRPDVGKVGCPHPDERGVSRLQAARRDALFRSGGLARYEPSDGNWRRDRLNPNRRRAPGRLKGHQPPARKGNSPP